MTELKVDITPDHVRVTYDLDGREIEVVNWVEEEWLMEPTTLPAICWAVHLAHTDPLRLMVLNAGHIQAQERIHERR